MAVRAGNENADLIPLSDRIARTPTVRRLRRLARSLVNAASTPNVLRGGALDLALPFPPLVDDNFALPSRARAPRAGHRMATGHLVELRKKEAWYWWHVNKRRLVTDLLTRCAVRDGSILEIGCGGGYLSASLSRAGCRGVASDIDYEAARFARDRGATETLVFDASGAWPFATGSFDVVLMLDVLEHLDDDAGALREAHRTLRANGTLVLTVPAHPFLLSSWDRMVGHRRRYTRSRLTNAVRSARFDIRKITAWNLISFLPAVVLRTTDRLFGPGQAIARFPEVPGWLNACLKWQGRIESLLCRRMNLRGGLAFAGVFAKG